jgi:hypothetical protein
VLARGGFYILECDVPGAPGEIWFYDFKSTPSRAVLRYKSPAIYRQRVRLVGRPPMVRFHVDELSRRPVRRRSLSPTRNAPARNRNAPAEYLLLHFGVLGTDSKKFGAI